jgi:hypothetical protein
MGKGLRRHQTLCLSSPIGQRVYHWARTSVQHEPISRAKYTALRARGHSHGRALRSVADRLLNVACAMLKNRTTFNRLDPQITS